MASIMRGNVRWMSEVHQWGSEHFNFENTTPRTERVPEEELGYRQRLRFLSWRTAVQHARSQQPKHAKGTRRGRKAREEAGDSAT